MVDSLLQFKGMEEQEEEEGEINESTTFNESVEFRGDMDSSFSSDVHSVSFQDITNVLRTKPDINIFYRTPCSGSSRFSRRSFTVRTTTDNDHINKLPESLLLRIFLYLSKADIVHTMGTCRRFNKIGKDHTLWEFMNLAKKPVDETSLHCILDRRMQVLRLTEAQVQAAPPIMSGYDFNHLSMCRLTHLDLGQATFTDQQTLCRLLSRCTSLMALNLEYSPLVNDELCREISKNQNLRYLDLVYVKRLSKVGLCSILCNCRKLIELNLAWAELDNEAVAVICQFLPPSLRRLNLSGLRDHPQMTDQNVSLLCSSCPHLEELDLSDNSLLTDRCLESITRLKYLSVLTLSRCYGIEPIAFVSLEFLKVLNIFGCITNEGLDMLRGRLAPTAINECHLCTIAKPTVGESVSSIWGRRTRDFY